MQGKSDIRRMVNRSFKSEFPELVEFWDESENEYGPEYYRPHSHEEVHWKCNNGHKYKMRIDYRSKRGCPICGASRRTSLPEQYIFELAKEVYGDEQVKNRFKLDGIEYDVSILSVKLLIEYDGVAWHKDKLDRHIAKALKAREYGYILLNIAEYKRGDCKPTHNYNKQGNQEVIYYELIGNYTNMNTLGDTLKLILSTIDIPNKHKIMSINLDDIRSRANANLVRCIPEEESFEYKHKDLMRFWNTEANNKMGIQPNKVSEASGVKVHWKCPKCLSERYESTHYMISRFNKCNKCGHRVYRLEQGFIEDIEHTNGKIKTCKIGNALYNNIRSTNKLLKILLEYLNTNNKQLFELIVKDDCLIKSNGRHMISDNIDDIRQPSKINRTNLYLDTNIDSNKALKIIQRIVYKYSLDKLIYIEYE